MFSHLLKTKICASGLGESCRLLFKNGHVHQFRPFTALAKHGKSNFIPRCCRQTTKRPEPPVFAYPEISVKGRKYVGRWLLACAGMCAGAVMIGGVTRLTESGLSITKWDPITGVVFPYNEAMWEEEFNKYKQFPEYKYLERELTMSDFKAIYFMEWFHRIWGRCVGAVFAIPAVVFWRKGWIASKMKPRVLVLGALIGLEACIGIFMVNSGLEDKPDSTEIPRVSQYRLAAHLGAALLLYTGFLWTGFNHLFPYNKLEATSRLKRFRMCAHMSKGMAFITALSGAFVAGLDAGLVYNSYPLFAGLWFPTDLWSIEPKWKNIFENHSMVQFNHRHLGELTGALMLTTCVIARKVPLPYRARLAVRFLLFMSIAQVSLGIATLVKFVPTDLAASHQGGALSLLGIAFWLTHELRRLPK